MAYKSRLKAALAREREVDFTILKQRKKAKLHAKQKVANAERRGETVMKAPKNETNMLKKKKQKKTKVPGEERGSDSEEDEEEEEDDLEPAVAALLDTQAKEGSSDIDRDEEEEQELIRNGGATMPADDEGSSDSEFQSEDDDEEEIDLEEIEDQLEEEDDVVPRQRNVINNTTALLASLKRLAGLPTSSFATRQMVVVESEPTEGKIPDVSDDLNRELQLLSQCRDAARKGRELLLKENVPFSRPKDYFAEMLRPEETMQKVKQKMIEEATAKKVSAEARKQRDLKKFGKQVQIAKLQERAKQKKETLEKIHSLKRKRAEDTSGLGIAEVDDPFDIAVDDELSHYRSKKPGGAGGKKRSAMGNSAPNPKRARKDSRYGFGGKKRHSKSGDAMSSGDLTGFSSKRMKSGGVPGKAGPRAKAPRPGKSRRAAARR